MARNDSPQPRALAGWDGPSIANGVAVSGMELPTAARATAASSANLRLATRYREYPDDQGGKAFTVRVQVRHSAARSIALELTFRTAGGSQTGTITSSNIAPGANGTAVLTFTATAPAGTYRVQPTILVRNAGAGESVLGTACRIVEGSVGSLPYADGYTSGWRWEGVAGQSTSTDVPAPEPAWTPNPDTTGVLRWAADTAQADAPSAGYATSGSQRQNAAGDFNDPTVPWPPPYYPAPFGREGRSLMLRVPDAYRRYEVVPHPDLTFADGDEAWFGVALAVGADTDTEQSDYQVLWQLHGSGPGGSPSVAIEASGGRWRLTGGANRPNPQTLAYDTGGTYAYALDLTANIVRERWYEFVIYVGFWSAINSGRVDVWCDGARVLQGFRPPCGTNYPAVDANDSGRAYVKSGLYHREAIRGGTTWLAQQTLATGYGAANPARSVTTVQGLDLSAI